ncbi:MAG: outer membrane beta-barrel protein [Myxococcota bacterium]
MHRTQTPLLAMLALTLTLLPSSARAQGTVTVEGNIRAGLGDWADISNPGLGVLVGGRYDLDDAFGLTARTGLIFGLPRTQTVAVPIFGEVSQSLRTNELPLLLGGRYAFGSAGAAPFVSAEFGLVNVTEFSVVRSEGSDDARLTSDSEARFALNVGGGFDAGDMEGRLSLLWIPLEDSDDLIGLWVSFGFDVFEF